MTATPRITVIGESLVDVVVTPHGEREFPGGSPMNVAVGLARLDTSVAFATVIGTDPRGDLLLDHLRRSGVELVDGSVVDARTSTSTALVDAEGSARYDFAIDWSLAGLAGIPHSAIIHTGSIASYLAPGAADVEGFLVDARDRAVITFDPNIRPSLIDSHPRTLGQVERIASLSTVVKLSDEDAGWLYPDQSADWVLSHLLELGVRLAVLTRGADGSVFQTTTERVRVPAAVVQVADTIGAGDSFMSGFIFCLDRLLAQGTVEFSGQVLRDIGEFSARCAGITVTRFGADPPSRADLHVTTP